VGALLRPIGPQPPAVYWRRRTVLVAVLALVLLLGDRALGADGAAGTAATRTTAIRTTAPATTAAATPRALVTCPDSALTVTVATDARVYPAGATPRLRITVANTGRTACRRDVGSRALGLVVHSGTDRIWSSDDCQQAPPSEVRTMRPGQRVTQSVSWPRRRSAAGCATPATATAGAGTYTLAGHAGTAQSPVLVFHLG
jgi:hypothetical protein